MLAISKIAKNANKRWLRAHRRMSLRIVFPFWHHVDVTLDSITFCFACFGALKIEPARKRESHDASPVLPEKAKPSARYYTRASI
jgi:hypothetical protein